MARKLTLDVDVTGEICNAWLLVLADADVAVVGIGWSKFCDGNDCWPVAELEEALLDVPTTTVEFEFTITMECRSLLLIFTPPNLATYNVASVVIDCIDRLEMTPGVCTDVGAVAG
uniref:Uncharacterized protein n=1 Tax=Romanomermis culicivorax TaxID=13658 RepID=A0A915K6P8_ROMCU